MAGEPSRSPFGYNQHMPTILIIEDETGLSKVLQSYLEKSGMKVLAATRGDQGISLWEQEKPDLVLLDLNLPGMDGLDVAREIRRSAEVPIIMVTARVEETDRLIGLELGADDYISKPYSPREVVARVKAVSQEVNTHLPAQSGSFPSWTLRSILMSIQPKKEIGF